MLSETRANARICLGCWDQMSMPIPIRGPLAAPFKIFGITQSKMNPNICTICERSFRYVKKQRHISTNASILFADIRGFTNLSERMAPLAVTEIVSLFQDQCAQAIWDQNGIVNKQMGDGLMAIFNFPIKIERHAEAAVSAGIDIQRRWRQAVRDISSTMDSSLTTGLGVGVGVHTGQVEIGEFSRFRSEFTAIGGPVNLTARLESKAAAGEILVSAEAAAACEGFIAGTQTRSLSLKGIEQPVTAHVLGADTLDAIA